MVKVDGLTVGIDLGTTFSCVGLWQDDQVKILTNDLDSHTTSSFVAFTDSEYLVGDAAKSHRAMNPANTVFDVKRLIGRKFSDPAVQEGIKHWPFKVVPDADDNPQIVVDFKGETKTFTPEDIASIILAKMKEVAEASLGSEVKSAVITVPASFDDSQRQAIKSAGALAGLNVLRVINEPTAACVAYGLDKKPGERYLLVFDCGGTLDVSMIWIEEGIYEVMATGGDLHLGGDAIDDRLVDHFVAEIKDKYGINISEDFYALNRLRTACERAKHALSIATEASIEIDSLVDGIDFRSTITRAHFEDLCSDLFLKMIEMMEKVLGDSKLSKSQVDEVVMVGGSTRIPKVQQLVTEFFDGKELLASINPDEAVATGAAIQAAAIVDWYSSEDKPIFCCMPLTYLSLGFESKGGVMSTVIPRNTYLPTRKTMLFSTSIDNQTDVLIQLYEGQRSLTHGNNLLGSFAWNGIPSMPRGKPEIAVTIDVDADYNITVSAVEILSGIAEKWILPGDNHHYDDEYCSGMIEGGERHQFDDEDYMQRLAAWGRLESFVYNLQRAFSEDEISLDTVERKMLEDKVSHVEAWQHHHGSASRDEIEAKLQELKTMVYVALDSADTSLISGGIFDSIQCEGPKVPLLPPRGGVGGLK
ncbi:unnamed protein product [Aphanomyces euteiches]